MRVTSEAFGAGERIPRVHAYRGEGENVAPPLAWTGTPAGTREFALICDDPDAPTREPWVHWVVCGIPATATGLPAAGAREGRNSWDETGWGGPLPPKGHGTHHYHFKVFALDKALDLGPGATKPQLLRALEGHVLAEAELVGTYERG